MKKAVVLVSGGLDSAVALFVARKNGYDCLCLAFDYGQRHLKELTSAKAIAKRAHAGFSVVKLDFPWKGSSLVDKTIHVPSDRTIEEIKSGIPSTYVPARNSVFISAAASYAEAIGADAVFIGAHHEDSSGYPDCRKDYLKTLGRALELGTKRGIEGSLSLEFPLIDMSKKDIVKLGDALGVPFELTWSCYNGGASPCMRCDSCVLRARGFREAGIDDPLVSKTPAKQKAEIRDIFSSIQGEGIFVGARQIFVRFDGCNLECAFCDEPRTVRPKEYTPLELLSEVRFLELSKGPHHSVSLTGGEPLVHVEFLKPFLKLLRKEKLKAYLETNGTLVDNLAEVIDSIDIIAMDFKLPSSTRGRPMWREHEKFLKMASRKKVFVKAVVTPETKISDIKKAARIVAGVRHDIPFVLQPASPVKPEDKPVDRKSLTRFFETISKGKLDNVRIIPQVHKVLNVK